MSEEQAQEQQEETTTGTAEAPSPAPEPAPAAQPAAQPAAEPKKAKAAKRKKARGGGCLPSVVALVFFVGTVYFYLESVKTKWELEITRGKGRAVAVSVLNTASTELVNAKASIEDRDFGDGARSLRAALAMILVARGSATDRAAVGILDRAQKATEVAIESSLATSKDTPEQVDVIIDQVKGCQEALASTWTETTQRQRNAFIARRWRWLKSRIVGSVEETVTMFEASSQATGGDASEETLMDDLVRGAEEMTKKIGDVAEKTLEGAKDAADDVEHAVEETTAGMEDEIDAAEKVTDELGEAASEKLDEAKKAADELEEAVGETAAGMEQMQKEKKKK